MNILKKTLTFCACSLSLAILVIPAYAQNEAAPEAEAPIILETTKIQEDGQTYVLAKGLVKLGHEVLIYINGVYSGLANISQGDTNFSLFNYLSPSIKNANNTEIIAIARNSETYILTPLSQAKVDSIIERTTSSQPAPKETISPIKRLVLAPILKTPKQKNCENKPYISGFSKNQTTVKIFIDNKLYTSLSATSNVAETAFFSYTPSVDLDRGQHFVYAVAEDVGGNISPKSNLLTFCVSDPQTISTSTLNEPEITSGLNTLVETNEHDLVFQKTNFQKETTTNMIQKNRINTNLFLFGFFVLIIIVWIIFVNKELLEDSKDQETKIK